MFNFIGLPLTHLSIVRDILLNWSVFFKTCIFIIGLTRHIARLAYVPLTGDIAPYDKYNSRNVTNRHQARRIEYVEGIER